MSFLTEITALVGTTATSTEVDAAMTAGCADTVRRVMLTNPEDLWLFTKTDPVPSNGLSVGTGRIYDVEVSGRQATVIDPSLRHRAAESDSINSATGEFPVYYLLNEKLHVIPKVKGDADTSLNPWTIDSFATAESGNETLITTSGGGNSGVHPFNVGDYAIIAQTVDGNSEVYVGLHRVTELTTTTSFKIEKNYSAAVATGYTVYKGYANATYIATHAADSSQSDISNFPSSYYRYPVLYAGMSVLMTRMNDLHGALPTLTIPTAPVIPTLLTQSESLPTYTPPSAFITPPTPIDADIDYTGVGSPPVMPSVEVAVMPILSFDLSDIVITALNISSPPIPPIAEDGSSGLLDFSTVVRGKAPEYVKPVLEVPAFPAIPALSIPEAPVAPTLDSPSDIDFSFASTGGNHPELTLPVMGSLDFDNVHTFIVTEEDPELAGSKLQEIQAKIGEYQANLSAEQLSFNRNMEIYKAQITEEMEEKKIKLSKENQSEQQKLAEYNAKVQVYQAEVNSKVTEWSKNYLELSYTKWVQEFEKNLARYQQDMTNEMNRFNMQVSEYQAEISKATADASNSVAVDQNRFQRKFQKYQGKIDEWKTLVNKELTEWQTQVAQPAMTKFTQIRAENLQSWQAECNNQLKLLDSRIAIAQQKHQADLQEWQALFTKATTTYTAETGYDISKYQAEVQAGVQKYQSDTDLEGNKFKSSLEKYTAEMNSIASSNNSENAQYQSELAAYQAKTQADLTKYNADVQKYTVEYKWFADKYILLKQEYNEGFLPNPQQQQQGV